VLFQFVAGHGRVLLRRGHQGRNGGLFWFSGLLDGAVLGRVRARRATGERTE